VTFGAFVRSRRAAVGISLRAAAQQLGVNPAYLSRVEAGKVAVSERLIHRLVGVLGCDEDEPLLLAGRLPEPIREMVAKQPSRVSSALRTMAEMCVAEPGTPYGEPLFAERRECAIEDRFPLEAARQRLCPVGSAAWTALSTNASTGFSQRPVLLGPGAYEFAARPPSTRSVAWSMPG
jgi:transcriptional regulator with XRE-family HTH domain